MPTVFHEPWWLEAASGGLYEEVTVSSGGRQVGRLPFMRQKQAGFVSLIPPQLTPFLGPAVDEGTGGTVSRNLRRHQITRELIAKLPPFSNFYQLLHRGTPDTLPFLLEGFDAAPHFTFEISPASEKTIWSNMRDKARNVIRRAQEQAELVEIDPATFCGIYDANLEARGRGHNYIFNRQATRVFEASLTRGCGRLLGARARDGSIAAAIFYVWDEAASYYMLATRTPASSNGLVSRLLWEAMRESAAAGRVFDFGGVGIIGNSTLFYTAFGGEVRPRYVVRRASRAFRAIRPPLAFARDSARRLRHMNLRGEQPSQLGADSAY